MVYFFEWCFMQYSRDTPLIRRRAESWWERADDLAYMIWTRTHSGRVGETDMDHCGALTYRPWRPHQQFLSYR